MIDLHSSRAKQRLALMSILSCTALQTFILQTAVDHVHGLLETKEALDEAIWILALLCVINAAFGAQRIAVLANVPVPRCARRSATIARQTVIVSRRQGARYRVRPVVETAGIAQPVAIIGVASPGRSLAHAAASAPSVIGIHHRGLVCVRKCLSCNCKSSAVDRGEMDSRSRKLPEIYSILF